MDPHLISAKLALGGDICPMDSAVHFVLLVLIMILRHKDVKIVILHAEHVLVQVKKIVQVDARLEKFTI